jgi:hypothetical protein
MADSFKAYMDATDFHSERGLPREGNRVYSTVEAVLEHHACADECGVVEVEVRFVRVAREPVR